MPNRYEREIEEILRNLEQTEPKQGLGQRFGERLRRKPAPQTRSGGQQSPMAHFTSVEWLLFSAVICALVAGGYAYILAKGTIFTGIVACIGFVCLVFVALSQFLLRPRAPRSVQYGNVTITPIRRSPLNSLKTRWNLFWMKVRYRRRDDKS